MRVKKQAGDVALSSDALRPYFRCPVIPLFARTSRWRHCQTLRFTDLLSCLSGAIVKRRPRPMIWTVREIYKEKARPTIMSSLTTTRYGPTRQQARRLTPTDLPIPNGPPPATTQASGHRHHPQLQKMHPAARHCPYIPLPRPALLLSLAPWVLVPVHTTSSPATGLLEVPEPPQDLSPGSCGSHAVRGSEEEQHT